MATASPIVPGAAYCIARIMLASIPENRLESVRGKVAAFFQRRPIIRHEKEYFLLRPGKIQGYSMFPTRWPDGLKSAAREAQAAYPSGTEPVGDVSPSY